MVLGHNPRQDRRARRIVVPRIESRKDMMPIASAGPITSQGIAPTQAACHADTIPSRDADLTPVIEVEGLRKEYHRLRGGSTVAVDGLTLEVPEGGVFGFLGPNGAGKTTTIRCLLGLVAPSAGRLRLLGAEVPGRLPDIMRRVGSIVETPALFPRFSGRRNLQVLARIDGIGSTAVAAALDRVGLSDRADHPVRSYSLGMKQRLGVAAALLKDPSMLILDEPANGLDPAGIVEVRELVRGLGAEGRTVFVSSHILSEIQQTADRVAILARGRLVTAGPVREVLAGGRAEGLIVGVRDLEAARNALAAAGIEATLRDGTLRVAVGAAESERVSRTLAERGLYVTELRADEADLETVFLELTRDQEPGQ
jgi:ABC-2 type transport system ATP-binding protein